MAFPPPGTLGTPWTIFSLVNITYCYNITAKTNKKGGIVIDVWKNLKDRIQGKAVKGEKRSGKWRKIRATHLEKNPLCAICGLKNKVEVHHVIPFNVAPDLELNPENLITLCENKKWGITCHLLVGHLGNYKDFNSSVQADATYWKIRLRKHPDFKK